MDNSDYKKYSLEKLQDWIHDALSSGEASPHEIYSAIREAVREDYYYFKHHTSRAYGLLALLNGERPVADKSVAKWKEWEETYYPEEYAKGKVTKWVLPVEVVRDEDTDKDEYCVTFPEDLLEAANLKEGDRVEWVNQGDGSYLIKKVN
jgi:hypothetical protein